ncbi:retrotransposon-like protein 1 [Apodemus sylvaticus]|uniref:retrotransposon-like protein 1 n=1 Tax=Apodemus sylvaticus TaxID=10129 RepID=UPI002242D127|nr:retrotransposon-like protein 1 [Apodemus sylvaticus]
MIEPSEDSFETMMELKNPSSKQMESSEGSSNTVEETPGSSGAQAAAQAQAKAEEEREPPSGRLQEMQELPTNLFGGIEEPSSGACEEANDPPQDMEQSSDDGSNHDGSNQESRSEPLSEASDYSMDEAVNSSETQSDRDDTDLGDEDEEEDDSEDEDQQKNTPEEEMTPMGSVVSMFLRMQDLKEQQKVAESIMMQAIDEGCLPSIRPFSGDGRDYHEFIVLCQMTMQNYPPMLYNDHLKVKFVISNMTDLALEWANNLVEKNSPVINDFPAFVEAMSEKFEYRQALRVAEDAMFSIRQGNRCAADYINEFRGLIPTLGWPDEVLQAHLCQGLNEEIRHYLFRIPQPNSLDNLIVLVLQLEDKLAERRALLRLPPESRPRSIAWMDRPTPEKWRVSGWPPHEFHPELNRDHIFVLLLVRVNPYHSVAVRALVDSGAEGNYMDERFAQEHYVELYEKPYPQRIRGVDGNLISNQSVWLCTEPLVCVQQKHYEYIEFDILPELSFSIILGRKWLRTHAPEVDWFSGRCTFHSPYCLRNCFTPPPPPIALEHYSISLLPGLPHTYSDLADVFNPREVDDETSDQPSSDGSDDLSESEPSELQQAGDSDQNDVLEEDRARETVEPVSARMQDKAREQEEYWILCDMLNDRQDNAQMIPELFDQLHGAAWFTKLEVLGIQEGEMKNSVTHTEDTWKASFGFGIHEMRRYRPYTISSYSDEGDNIVNLILKDFLGYFAICHGREVLVYSMSQEEHPQHVRQVLVRFRSHNMYCSLDRTQFHRQTAEILGFHISPKGVKLSKSLMNHIVRCPVPQTRRCLQGVIEFFYPYRQFVENFRVIIEPLVRQMLSSEPYYWGEEEQEAFDSLKRAFRNSPVLYHPKPQNPFYLETGITGSYLHASLVQTDYETGKTATCAFYSRPLSQREEEYPPVEMRILPIRASFMVWCRYLENTEEPIMILLNTEDLASLNNDRLTVLLPGHWLFFFSHFNFSVTEAPDPGDPQALFRRCWNQRGFRARFLGPLLLSSIRARQRNEEEEEGEEEEEEEEEANMAQELLGAIPMDHILNGYLAHFSVVQIRTIVLNFFRGLLYWKTIVGVAALLVMLRARRPVSPLPAPSLEVARPQPRHTLRLILDSTLIASSGMATAIAQLLSQMPPLVGANTLPARELAELFLGPRCWHRNALHSHPPRGMRFTPGFWLTLCEFFGVRVNPEDDVFPDPHQHRYLELHVVGDEDVVLREALQDDLQRYRQSGLHDGLQDTSQDAQDNDVQEDLLDDREAVTFRPRNLLDPEVLDFLNNRLLYTLGADGRLTLLSRDQVARALTRFLTLASRMALPSPAREQARLEELSDSDDELD